MSLTGAAGRLDDGHKLCSWCREKFSGDILSAALRAEERHDWQCYQKETTGPENTRDRIYCFCDERVEAVLLQKQMRFIRRDASLGCLFCSLVVAVANKTTAEFIRATPELHAWFESPAFSFTVNIHCPRFWSMVFFNPPGIARKKKLSAEKKKSSAEQKKSPAKQKKSSAKQRKSLVKKKKSSAKKKKSSAKKKKSSANKEKSSAHYTGAYFRVFRSASAAKRVEGDESHRRQGQSLPIDLGYDVDDVSQRHQQPVCRELGVIDGGGSKLARLEATGRRLRRQLDQCTETHPLCKPPGESSAPGRLLKLSGTVSSPTVQLVQIFSQEKTHPALIQYACLSYVWGGAQRGMTTQKNIEAYSHSIEASRISKTVYDAIRVTMSLGLEFLWVDAYCIVQDSAQDKTAELAKMASIYASAFCTIAVTCADSAAEGFLGPVSKYDRRPFFSVEYPSSRGFDWPFASSRPECAFLPAAGECIVVETCEMIADLSFEEMPLFSRAWTLQETMLSPRVILFPSSGYSIDPILRCSKAATRSDGAELTRIPSMLRYPVIDLFNKDGSSSWPIPLWYDIVNEYTSRRLTNQEDMLPALAGIADEYLRQQELGQVTCGTYHAGLWSHTMVNDLLWQGSGQSEPSSPYIGPSWSWVCAEEGAKYCYDFASASVLVLGIETLPLNPAVPNGAIKEGAWIRLACGAEDVSVPGEAKYWQLFLASEEPYNNAYWVGLFVEEVERTGGKEPECSARTKWPNEPLYRRVGFFRDGGLVHGRMPLKEFIII